MTDEELADRARGLVAELTGVLNELERRGVTVMLDVDRHAAGMVERTLHPSAHLPMMVDIELSLSRNEWL